MGFVGFYGLTNAQSKSENLFDLSDIKTVGLYVSPEYQFGQLGGGFTGFAGGSIMFILNKQFAIGAAGYKSTSESFSPTKYSPLFAKGAIGGGKIEYTINPDGLIHYTIPVFVGVGRASLDSASSDWFEQNFYDDNFTHRSNDFLVFQAGATAEMNLLRYAKFFVGANYRYSTVNDDRTVVLDNSMLQGISFNAGLKLGLFDFSVSGN